MSAICRCPENKKRNGHRCGKSAAACKKGGETITDCKESCSGRKASPRTSGAQEANVAEGLETDIEKGNLDFWGSDIETAIGEALGSGEISEPQARVLMRKAHIKSERSRKRSAGYIW